jgi:predicted lipoprotein with Yx(FWY)xxD motif
MRYLRMVAVGLVGLFALAACGGGGGSGAHASNGSYSAPAASATADAAPATTTTVTTANTSLGSVLVDGHGFTLYGLTNDVNGMPSCTGACASVWPPATVTGPALPAGLDAHTFSVVTRPDGSYQLRAGTWPLYRYAGDAAAGDTNGQGSGGVWFAVAPTGKLHKS